MQNNYYGLILGKNQCNLAREFASVAIDVDILNNDIRPIRCPQEICEVDGDCISFVSEDCCKGEYWSVCTASGIVAVENGKLWCADDKCSDHTELCVPTPIDPVAVDLIKCNCGEVNTTVRYAYINDKGAEGPLSPASNVGTTSSLNFTQEVALYIEHDGAWFCQGRGTSFDPSNLKLGLPPISEGWCLCPENVKFLVEHSSGSLMTTSGKNIYISHPFHRHLWGKYTLKHCREIVSLMEVNGTVFAFDGKNGYSVELMANGGFKLSQFDSNICIESNKQLAEYNGIIFSMTNQGPRSITGSQFNRSTFSFLDSSTINPNYFCGDNKWAVGVHGSKMHFSNGEKSWIYDLLAPQQFALTESSLVADDYYSDCTGIYYLSEGKVWKWNPCEGDYCPYTYCTSPDKREDCHNPGVLEVYGSEFGNQRTKVKVYYLDSCCKQREICETEVCFCKPMSITGCENARGVKTCYEGTDIIFAHQYVTSQAELR